MNRENLERWLVGRRIRRASLPDSLLRGRQPRRRVESALADAEVRSVARRGKFLLLGTSNGHEVVSHLGMTGKYVRLELAEPEPRFTRALLELSDDARVALVDARRLGAFRLLTDKERGRLNQLGVEPLDARFDTSFLFERTRKSRRPIKLFLMDQKRVAGLGNIHVAEALYLARIHPVRAASSLTRAECRALVRAIKRELRAEIRSLRSERVEYLIDGKPNPFRVYGRAGEPCRKCRQTLEAFSQSGRTTYFCPGCQLEFP